MYLVYISLQYAHKATAVNIEGLLPHAKYIKDPGAMQVSSDVSKAWRVKAKAKAKASTHKAKTKAKVTVFWPEAKAKAKTKA
jgi:hypothetical protein